MTEATEVFERAWARDVTGLIEVGIIPLADYEKQVALLRKHFDYKPEELSMGPATPIPRRDKEKEQRKLQEYRSKGYVGVYSIR